MLTHSRQRPRRPQKRQRQRVKRQRRRRKKPMDLLLDCGCIGKEICLRIGCCCCCCLPFFFSMHGSVGLLFYLTSIFPPLPLPAAAVLTWGQNRAKGGGGGQWGKQASEMPPRHTN